MKEEKHIGRNSKTPTKPKDSDREKLKDIAESIREVLDSNSYECVSVPDNASDAEASLQALITIKLNERTGTLLSLLFCSQNFQI